MPAVSVVVRKGGRVIERVERPLHATANGPAVRYRGRLWSLTNDTIDLDGPAVGDSQTVRLLASAEPPAAGPDLAQQAVTLMSSDARALVDAGPGTGKTHVACQRIAHLINCGVEPGRIWVVSFTRTAISEFRDRIARALTDEAAAASIQIRTLDAHAWTIHSGFSRDVKLTGSYDDNIRSAADRIREDDDAADFLGRLEHLVIDEAQDILGERAEWCLALIDRLAPGCGVTVFSDEAQSIYDFTGEAGRVAEAETLPAVLRRRGFAGAALSRVHRTGCPKLIAIFTDVRREVLKRGGRAQARCRRIRDDIVRLAHGDAGPLRELKLEGLSGSTLVLLRRRADVLERSSYAGDVPHRLRMSGLPARLMPWIAALLWDFTEGRLTRADFEARWDARVAGQTAAGAPDSRRTWQLLLEAAGDESGRVQISQLRKVLGRSTPPVLFCSPEYGDEGPVLGTIHASKGREADEVRLYLPPLAEDESIEEETRVAFVGATRARAKLLVGEAPRSFASSTKDGRVYRVSSQTINVEVGRADDIRADGLVGKAAFSTEEDARAAQDSWRTLPRRTGICARQLRELNWAYELCGPNWTRLGVLSAAFKDDMSAVANKAGRFPPASFLPYLRSLGLRTIALAPEEPELELLHEPWRTSGFMFAPMLTAFSPGKFGRR